MARRARRAAHPADDFDFYLDLLGTTADTIGKEHTLKMAGGAFWNMLGSMNEMELPVFVLINVVQKAYSKSNAPLFERLKTLILQKAKEYAKLMSDQTRRSRVSRIRTLSSARHQWTPGATYPWTTSFT